MRFYKKFYVMEKPISTHLEPASVFESIKDIVAADQESFWLLGYNVKNAEIYRECIFLGGMNSCIVDPKIVFKRLLLHDCAKFIVIHNHPSGNKIPSEEDTRITRKLLEAAKTLELVFMDHIIASDTGYFSYAENKLIF